MSVEKKCTTNSSHSSALLVLKVHDEETKAERGRQTNSKLKSSHEKGMGEGKLRLNKPGDLTGCNKRTCTLVPTIGRAGWPVSDSLCATWVSSHFALSLLITCHSDDDSRRWPKITVGELGCQGLRMKKTRVSQCTVCTQTLILQTSGISPRQPQHVE